jgi:hypothetical protein
MASTTRHRRRTQPGCITIVALLLLAVAGWLMLHQFFLEQLAAAARALRWEAVPCVVEVSRGEEVSRDAVGTVYRAVIRFRYEYDQRFRTSTRLAPVRPQRETAADVQRILDRYPVGSRQVCYVDPADPAMAVLERGLQPGLLVALVPAGMMAIGLGGLFSLGIGWLRRGPPPRVDCRYRPTLRPRGTRRPLRLRTSRRVRGLPTAIVLAVGFGFCIFFLVREVLHDWSQGVPACHELALTAVTLVLLVVALVLAAVPVAMVLRMLGPHPSVRIDSLKVTAGRPTEFTWRIRGHFGRPRRLVITLEGREEATYAQDDHWLTEREVFYSAGLLAVTGPPSRGRGTTQVTVPAQAPPSFTGRWNAIIWVVRFRLEMRFWPDVEDEMELTVLANPEAWSHA